MVRGLTWDQDIEDATSEDIYAPVTQPRRVVLDDCDPWANDNWKG